MDPHPKPDPVDSLDLGGVAELPSAFILKGDMEAEFIHQWESRVGGWCGYDGGGGFKRRSYHRHPS